MANQEACVCSRFTFIEADEEQADRYARLLSEQIRIDRMGEGTPRPLEPDLREQIETLRMMDEDYGVFGALDGRGIAIARNVSMSCGLPVLSAVAGAWIATPAALTLRRNSPISRASVIARVTACSSL